MIALGLIAAGFDENLVRVIIFLVIAAVYGINYLIKALRSIQKNVNQRPVMPEQVEARQQLQRELEQFVRKARGESAARSQPTPPPAPAPEKKKRRRLASETPPGNGERPTPAQAANDAKRHRVVESRLEQHIDTSRFDQRAKQLTHIEQEAEQMDQQVHRTFDHQLGALDVSRAPVSETPPEVVPTVAVANPLIDMLRDPQSVRHAIVLQEIFTRPEHRW